MQFKDERIEDIIKDKEFCSIHTSILKQYAVHAFGTGLILFGGSFAYNWMTKQNYDKEYWYVPLAGTIISSVVFNGYWYFKKTRQVKKKFKKHAEEKGYLKD